MQAVVKQSIMLTFNPLNVKVQAVLDHIRATKEIKVANVVEESPYDPTFVARMRKISKGKFTKHNLEDL